LHTYFSPFQERFFRDHKNATRTTLPNKSAGASFLKTSTFSSEETGMEPPLKLAKADFEHIV
jgi:hypothetical protein